MLNGTFAILLGWPKGLAYLYLWIVLLECNPDCDLSRYRPPAPVPECHASATHKVCSWLLGNGLGQHNHSRQPMPGRVTVCWPRKAGVGGGRGSQEGISLHPSVLQMCAVIGAVLVSHLSAVLKVVVLEEWSSPFFRAFAIVIADKHCPWVGRGLLWGQFRHSKFPGFPNVLGRLLIQCKEVQSVQ